MAEWHRVCKVDSLEEGQPRGEWIAGKPIAVFVVSGRCYAVSDICTHDLAILSEGVQEGDIVACPLHGARFRVTDGKCLGPPAEEDLETFEVAVKDDGYVYVSVPPAE